MVSLPLNLMLCRNAHDACCVSVCSRRRRRAQLLAYESLASADFENLDDLITRVMTVYLTALLTNNELITLLVLLVHVVI